MAGGSRNVQLNLTIQTPGCNHKWLRRAALIAAAALLLAGWVVATVFTADVGGQCGAKKTGATWWALAFEAAVAISTAVIAARGRLRRRAVPLMVLAVMATVLVMGEAIKYLPGGREAWFGKESYSFYNYYTTRKGGRGWADDGDYGDYGDYGNYGYNGYYRYDGSHYYGSHEYTCEGRFTGAAVGFIILLAVNFCALMYLAVVVPSDLGNGWFGMEVEGSGATEMVEREGKVEAPAAGGRQIDSDEFFVVGTKVAAKGAQGYGDATV